MQNEIKVMLVEFVESSTSSEGTIDSGDTVTDIIGHNRADLVDQIDVRGTILLDKLIELGFYTKQDGRSLQVCIKIIYFL